MMSEQVLVVEFDVTARTYDVLLWVELSMDKEFVDALELHAAVWARVVGALVDRLEVVCDQLVFG